MQAAKLWKYLFSKEHLREHYYEKIKPKPSIGLDRITPEKFEKQLNDQIEIIVRKTNNNSYHFTRYKQLLFLKNAFKPPRSVCVPTIRDKLTLSSLNELINGVYGKYCKTQMPQVIIDDIMSNIEYYDSFIKLDIKSFYSTICQEVLFKKLKRQIRKKEILNLIKKAIQTPAISLPVTDTRNSRERTKGIPEGLSISNSLSNIYMIDIDKKYSCKNNIAYYRYVDDILLLVNEDEFDDLKKEITKDVQNLKLEFNEKIDQGRIDIGFEYLGYKINSKAVTVRQSGVLKLEQSIEELFREINNKNINYIEWKINLKITGFILEKKKYGWLFYYSQITDLSLLFHLDNILNKFIKRYKVDGKIKLKRFVRSFQEINKALHSTKYIPNLDDIDNKQKQDILSKIYNIDLKDKSSEEIEVLFRKVMKKEIINIEKDIQNIS